MAGLASMEAAIVLFSAQQCPRSEGTGAKNMP